VSKEADAE